MAGPKTRSPEELLNQDLNYFIAFDVPPTETNVKKIEEALIQKRKTMRGINATEIRLNELKDDINETMLNNAALRKQESEAALKFYLARAIEVAKTVCQSGYIEDTKIADIAKKYYVKSDDVLNGIQSLLAQGVELKKVSGVKREVNFTCFKEMEQNLRTLGKKDLYDFSELPSNTPTKVLFDKQEEIYCAYQKKASSNTGKAAQDLSGIGKVVFKSDAAKREYDIYLKCKNNVWNSLNAFRDSGITVINDKVFMECIGHMRSDAGLSLEEAEKELYAYMGYFRLIRETSEKITIEICPYDDCKQPFIVKDGLKTCPCCGKSLEIKCWNCGQVMLFKSNAQICDECGVAKSNQQVFGAAQNDFNSLLKNTSATEIDMISAINKMENIHPTYEKFPESFIYKSIASAKQQLENKKKEIEKQKVIYDKYIKDINILIVKKLFSQAQVILNNLKTEDPMCDTKEIEAKISTAFKNAQLLVDKANSALKMGKEGEAIECCSKALEFCADNSAALQILKSYPPKAPKALVAKTVRNTIKLEWKTEGDQNAITYTVLRKIGSVPTHHEDGEVLESDLTLDFLEDTSAVSATAYYYAVFAVRGGVKSDITATTDVAVRFLDVFNIHQQKTENSIQATWNAPDNVQSIEVYRKEGAVPPLNKNDGEAVTVQSKTGFTDNNATEDKYSYLILCKYNFLGKEYYSNGVRVSYKKYRMPKKLSNVSIQTTGSATDFVFNCDEPQNGTIKLYVSKRQIDYSYNEIDDIVNFAKRTKDLKELDVVVAGSNKLYFTIPDNSIMWVYPVVSNEQLYLISEPIIVNTIVGIESVNVITKNDTVIIEGFINPNIRNLVAVINNTEFVTTVDGVGEKRTCSYDTFIKDNGFYLSLKPGLHYITVFAEFNEGGNKVYSRPTKLPEVIDNREKTVVEYVLNYTPSVTSSYKVKVDFRSEIPLNLPSIDVVAGFPKPLNKNSGIVVATIDGGMMKKKLFKDGYHLSVSVSASSAKSAKDKVVLFLHSDAEKSIRLKEVK